MEESKKGTYFKKKTGKFVAQYWNKDLKSTIAIGSFDTEEEAILARASHIRNVYDGIVDDSLPRTQGLPKGITYVIPGRTRFQASLQFYYGKNNDKKCDVHIGTYDTQEEAVEARKQFILGLL